MDLKLRWVVRTKSKRKKTEGLTSGGCINGWDSKELYSSIVLKSVSVNDETGGWIDYTHSRRSPIRMSTLSKLKSSWSESPMVVVVVVVVLVPSTVVCCFFGEVELS